MSKNTTATSRPLGITDHGMLQVPSGHESIVYREFAQNVFDHMVPGFEGSKLMITSHRGGTRFADNSCGMTASELDEYFGSYGAGSKPKSASGHFGFGAKESVFVANKICFTSWTPQQDMAHRITLEKKESNRGITIEVILRDGNSVQALSKKMLEKGSPHGTIVDCIGLKFDPQEALSYLNQRFLKVPCPVEIDFSSVSGKNQDVRKVKGLLACLEEASMQVGSFKTQNYEFHWGILKEGFNEKKVKNPEWKKTSFTLCQGDEAIKWWSGNGGLSMLRNCGIKYGRDRVVVICLPKKKKLEVDLFRSSIIGFSAESMQEEFRGNVPQELLDFQDAFAAKHMDDDYRREIVGYFVSELDLNTVPIQGVLPGKSPSAKKAPGEKPTKKAAGDGAKRSSSGERRRRQKPSGQLNVVFLDDGMGEDLLSVVKGNKTLECQVNLDSDFMRKFLGSVDKGQFQNCKVFITVDLMNAFHKHWQAIGDEPDDRVLESALISMPMTTCYQRGLISMPSKFKLQKHKKANAATANA